MNAPTPPSAVCAEEFRDLANLGEPDVRMRSFVVDDGSGWRNLDQTDRHRAISRFALLSSVPEDIRVQFDVARNLYMYAWHVYRFHAVADQHALATLEMALRESLISRGHLNEHGMLEAPLPPPAKVSSARLKDQRVMLKMLIRHAAAYDMISNDRLVNTGQWAERIAEQDRAIELIQLMEQQGLTEIEVPPEPPALTDDHLKYDWIGSFVELLPSLRNTYAHGGSQIHATVLRTFDVVSDLINQLYPMSGSL
jgi:hypothetical protein